MIRSHLDYLKAQIGEIVRRQELQAVSILRAALGLSEDEPMDPHRSRIKVVTLAAIRTRQIYVDEKPVVRIREPEIVFSEDSRSYRLVGHVTEDLR